MKSQRGVTLISLLVGLIVSSIVLVGMMMIFRNTIQTAVPASESSRSDGERVSALLSVHMMIQDSGFGIEDAVYGSHLQVLNNNIAVLLDQPQGSKATGDTLVWLSNKTGSLQCNGLQADSKGGLWRFLVIALWAISPQQAGLFYPPNTQRILSIPFLLL